VSYVDVVGTERVIVGTVLDCCGRLRGGNGDGVGVELLGLSCDFSVGLVCFVFLWGSEVFVECVGYALVGVE